ncbi:hypothetical protein [Butyrivibrio sp. LC3010]|nr:hypothetical protein [Butyrivibrio sp. LC3010]
MNNSRNKKKDEQDNLTQNEKQMLKKLVKSLKDEAAKNRRDKS